MQGQAAPEQDRQLDAKSLRPHSIYLLTMKLRVNAGLRFAFGSMGSACEDAFVVSFFATRIPMQTEILYSLAFQRSPTYPLSIHQSKFHFGVIRGAGIRQGRIVVSKSVWGLGWRSMA